jgi:GntR family transcriptional regulator
MAFDFHISTGSTTPIFRQIVDQVRLAVATGQLAPGQPLPSVRALAQQLLLNPNTIAKAYTELAREGLIETRAGKGAVIAALREVYTEAERRRRLGPAIEALVREAISLGFTPQQVQQLVRQQFEQFSSVPGRMGKP